MTAGVKIIDSGMEDFERKVKKLRGRVDAGVFGEKDSEMVIIAGTHEFGTDRAGKNRNITIPQRAFIRAALDEQEDVIEEKVDKAKVDIITGRQDKRRFLNRLGLWFVGRIQQKILVGGEPYRENAESVRLAKAARGRTSAQPLNDEGRLRQSITHKVEI